MQVQLKKSVGNVIYSCTQLPETVKVVVRPVKRLLTCFTGPKNYLS